MLYDVTSRHYEADMAALWIAVRLLEDPDPSPELNDNRDFAIARLRGMFDRCVAGETVLPGKADDHP